MDKLKNNRLILEATDNDSSGLRDNTGQLLTKNQAKFFVNSLCRDYDDNLIRVYHSTNVKFDKFDKAFIGSNKNGGAEYGKGFYFTDENPNNSGIAYGKYLNSFYLNLESPFIYENDNIEDFLDMLIDGGYKISKKEYNNLVNTIEDGLAELIEKTCGSDKIQDYLIEAGFDGIMNIDVGDYIAFEPNQIKATSNKNPTNSEYFDK